LQKVVIHWAKGGGRVREFRLPAGNSGRPVRFVSCGFVRAGRGRERSVYPTVWRNRGGTEWI